MDNLMLPIQKVADFLGVNMPQVRNLINAGKLSGVMEDGKMLVSAESVTNLVSADDKFAGLKGKLGSLTGMDLPDVEMPNVDMPDLGGSIETEIPDMAAMEYDASSAIETPDFDLDTAAVKPAIEEPTIAEPVMERTSAPARVASKVEESSSGGGMKWLLPLLGLLILAALAWFAFTSFSGGGETDGAAESSNAAVSDGETMSEDDMAANSDTTIALIENPWPASELNVAVAKNLLENELGYTVEVIQLSESAQWDALATGDADASLEVWPSGHSESIADYIDDKGVVIDGGALGPKGEIGWYIPTYMLDEHPELATWEGFQSAENAALFSTAETGSNGRFLGADPSWTQYDESIISNLGLPLEVVWSGSEEALLAEVSSYYSRNEPILFYFYSPHAVFSQFDMTQVQLPAYTDECYADTDGGSVACAYPEDNLMKIISAELPEKAPSAYDMLNAMNYDNADQISMLGALDEGLSVADAAQAWIDANGDVWADWVK